MIRKKAGYIMNKNLLIVGAGTYGVVASEIATDMGCFEKIAFVDDERKTTPNGIETRDHAGFGNGIMINNILVKDHIDQEEHTWKFRYDPLP